MDTLPKVDSTAFVLHTRHDQHPASRRLSERGRTRRPR